MSVPLLLLIVVCVASAHVMAGRPWNDRALTPAQRAAALIANMTTEEKLVILQVCKPIANIPALQNDRRKTSHPPPTLSLLPQRSSHASIKPCVITDHFLFFFHLQSFSPLCSLILCPNLTHLHSPRRVRAKVRGSEQLQPSHGLGSPSSTSRMDQVVWLVPIVS
jgi:hypothetical protein